MKLPPDKTKTWVKNLQKAVTHRLLTKEDASELREGIRNLIAQLDAVENSLVVYVESQGRGETADAKDALATDAMDLFALIRDEWNGLEWLRQ